MVIASLTIHHPAVFFYVDINECELRNNCTQLCVNNQGSYTCSCNQYFEIDPADWTNCVGKCYQREIISD